MVKKTTLVLVLTLFLTALITGINGTGNFMGNIIGNILFSNKGYAKNIEIQTYLMSEDKLGDMMKNHWRGEIAQESHAELYGKQVYLLLRVKNNANPSAWGMLQYSLEYSGKSKIYIDNIPRGEFFNYIIPKGKYFTLHEKLPQVDINWEQLFVK